MTEVDELQFTTLAQRIAALNQTQAVQASNGTGKKQAPPPPPPRPASEYRSNSVNNPPIASLASSVSRQINNQPASASSNTILPPPHVERDVPKHAPPLPSRKQSAPALPSRSTSQQISPTLPPRRPSAQQVVVRRSSNDSITSQNSNYSTFSVGQSVASTASSVGLSDGRKLPPTLDQANLPPLPPTKRELAEKARLEKEAKAVAQAAARAPLLSTKSAPIVIQMPMPVPLPVRIPSVPSLPPRVPSRSMKAAPLELEPLAILPLPTARRLPPATIPLVEARPDLPASIRASALPSGKPPPIPYSSKPTDSQLSRRAAKPAPIPRLVNECLICRDFSGPDRVAAQYPRLSNPDNSIAFLAEVLCGPFDSATDKARAIFTWLHYNIDYDVDAFFGNNVRHSSPENTIAKGLAVCGGYAGVYSAIASKAGLQCVMVTGHGKGYGHTALKDGDRIPPPDPTGHAWNAIRIDNGEWKLLDSCWGAGNVCSQKYSRKFSPSCFTASNEDFGEKHFPVDNRYFFRADGSIPTWEQYIRGRNACEPLKLYGVVGEYGINEHSFLPLQKQIAVGARGTTRFQFSKMCPHWDHIKNGGGQPYCMILQVNGLDGREKDFIPFDYDGTFWWADVETKHLGCAPQQINAYAVTTIGGKDGRGVTKREYLSRKGKEGMGFQSVATWDLV